MPVRVFTQDVGANFSKGDVRDYPKGTWDQIVTSVNVNLKKGAKCVKLEDFTRLPQATETPPPPSKEPAQSAA